MGTHLKVLSESFLMNINMTRFRSFSSFTLYYCALDESNLSIGRIKVFYMKSMPYSLLLRKEKPISATLIMSLHLNRNFISEEKVQFPS